ncbi:MAG TPA: amino acid ABC transporter substrate-binding protein [Candidatus Ventrisoma faecale]|nr:amino acid ABC transporter substrate-binding protein [Candidatus Ventrisoma faecale]
MRKITLVLTAAALAFGLTACGSKAEEPAETVQAESAATEAATETAEAADASEEAAEPAEEKTTFTLGFDQNFPPFGYVGDDGEYTGFDIDLAAECTERMGLELVLTPVDWDAKDLELSSGAIDCIWNGFTMNGREDDYTFTDPYMDNSQVMVVRTDSGINTLADLAGKIVEVQRDSTAEAALADDDHKELTASFAQLIPVADYNTAFMDLESGAVEAIAIDIGVARFQIEGKEDSFKILDETISTEQYAVGFLKGNTELRDQVQATLMEMVEDGTFAEISEKWFGYDVCTLGE